MRPLCYKQTNMLKLAGLFWNALKILTDTRVKRYYPNESKKWRLPKRHLLYLNILFRTHLHTCVCVSGWFAAAALSSGWAMLCAEWPASQHRIASVFRTAAVHCRRFPQRVCTLPSLHIAIPCLAGIAARMNFPCAPLFHSGASAILSL